MKNRCIISVASLLLGAFALNGVAFAHGTAHGKSVAADARMQKLHAMMPMFSVAIAELEAALEKGDAFGANVQAEKKLAAVPDLKKARPHKNVKQLRKFADLATNLEKTVALTADLVKAGDFAGATAAFRKVEDACAACHARFRD